MTIVAYIYNFCSFLFMLGIILGVYSFKNEIDSKNFCGFFINWDVYSIYY
ncbi:hypothetical protein IGL98_000437 [Enterococcus sp. DIV0840]